MSPDLTDPRAAADPGLINAYAAAYYARARFERMPGQRDFTGPGIAGVLGEDGRSQARLLVVDDRALQTVQVLLTRLNAGLLNVLHTAPRTLAQISGDSRWRHSEDTAMVRHDLEAIPHTELIPDLQIAAIRRRAEDPDTGVDLAAAVSVTVRADPHFEGSPQGFLTYLRAVPPALRLYAAVDHDGRPVATSGVSVYGEEARVVFVNTLAEWRGRGVARAMTAHAMREARAAGARRSTLDATALGRPVYERLGFAAVSGIARFSRGI